MTHFNWGMAILLFVGVVLGAVGGASKGYLWFGRWPWER